VHVSERRACAALGQHRSTQRKVPRGRDDEQRLTADIIALARQYGRYGYRKIAGLLRQAGWAINDKRVERIWRREGLKVPSKQPKRGRLWLADGSCIRLRPQHRDHVWSYDFVEDRTHDGRRYRMLNVLDEFTHECLAIRVARRLKAVDVIDVLSDLFILRGIPGHIRSDNGPEFVAEAVQEWIRAMGAKTAYIERASPWENGYIEMLQEVPAPPTKCSAVAHALLTGVSDTGQRGRRAAARRRSPLLPRAHHRVHDEWGCRLDQAREGHWFLGSMMVVAWLSRTAARCAAYGQSIFYLGESAAGPESTVCSHQSAGLPSPSNRRTRRLSMLSILPISNAARWN
jgi:putative transposase